MRYRIQNMVLTISVFLALLAGIFPRENTIPAYLTISAASASITLETDEETIQVGDTVVVRLVVQGTSRIGGFEAFLTYNSKVLEFQQTNGLIAGGEGLIRISELEPAQAAKNRVYEITFLASAVGGCEIAIKEKAHVYGDEDGSEMSTSSNSLSIKIEAEETASSNTRLQTLKISPGKLVPDFSPHILEYELEVSGETERLVISAIPEDEKAIVTVEGNQDFIEGENQVEVTVQAENADSQVYLLRVKKEGESSGKQEEYTDTEDRAAKEDNTANTTDNSKFSIREKSSGFLFSGYYQYHVVSAPAKALAELPKGYESYTMVLYGKKVPAYRLTKGWQEMTAQEQNESTEQPSQVLVYVDGIGSDSGELEGTSLAGFYEFDTRSKTMTRMQTETKLQTVEVIKEVDRESTWILYIIIVVLGVMCLLLGLGMVQISRRRRRF